MTAAASTERVHVTIRCRPPNSTELAKSDYSNVVEIQSEQHVAVEKSLGETKKYNFDHVLGPDTTQQKVFEACGMEVVDSCLNGYNGTIMAYGQTGTGKTFTLSNHTPGQEGVISRAMVRLFETADRDPDHDYEITVSYIQIYREMVQDLLDTTKDNLAIRENNNGMYLDGVTKRRVTHVDEVIGVITEGNTNRVVANTKMNAESSRSHAVLFTYIDRVDKMDERVYTENKNTKRTKLSGKLVLLDLAGSERMKRTKAVGVQAQEGRAINLSLTALGNVIHALSDPKIKHIPYRDSKLTRLLADSLGGDAKTSLLVAVGPDSESSQETCNSLNFAQRAMKVQQMVKQHVEQDYRALAAKLQAELDAMADVRLQLETKLEEANREKAGLAARVTELEKSAVEPQQLEVPGETTTVEVVKEVADPAQQARIDELIDDLETTQDELDDALNDLVDARRRVDELQAEVDAAAGFKEQLEEVEADAAERVGQVNEELFEMQKELDEALEERDTAESELENLKDELEDVKADLVEAEERVEELEEAEIEKDSELEDLKDKVQELGDKLAEVTGSLAATKNQATRTAAKTKDAEQTINNLKEDLQRAQSRSVTATAHLAATTAFVEALASAADLIDSIPAVDLAPVLPHTEPRPTDAAQLPAPAPRSALPEPPAPTDTAGRWAVLEAAAEGMETAGMPRPRVPDAGRLAALCQGVEAGNAMIRHLMADNGTLAAEVDLYYETAKAMVAQLAATRADVAEQLARSHTSMDHRSAAFAALIEKRTRTHAASVIQRAWRGFVQARAIDAQLTDARTKVHVLESSQSRLRQATTRSALDSLRQALAGTDDTVSFLWDVLNGVRREGTGRLFERMMVMAETESFDNPLARLV
ncbi:Kinesin motor domain [Carpediemonas membranifera]|uniref:Kinesin motor domain n=1 Tax=Carpediemonas membranifera TaxID=201153 RepID=A0A8J6BGK4_9EUKA|nr:Kinesin motor domain [Carpediemonas membranifera]|eukprot:KAG9397062.1 Kinesin motor domain [Carpediemonas membranifera]